MSHDNSLLYNRKREHSANFCHASRNSKSCLDGVGIYKVCQAGKNNIHGLVVPSSYLSVYFVLILRILRWFNTTSNLNTVETHGQLAPHTRGRSIHLHIEDWNVQGYMLFGLQVDSARVSKSGQSSKKCVHNKTSKRKDRRA